MGEREMEFDLSSFRLLADTAALVSEGKLSLTPSTEIRETGRIPKKTKETGLGTLIGPSELPIDYKDKVQEICGRDVTLVVEKKLTATDMSRGQSRLSIPKKQIRQCFLSEEEIRTLDRKEGIKVSLIEPCLEVFHGLQLKKWNYTSKNFSYMLTERWNAVAHPYERNELTKDVVIQLWSFRVDGNLCFCLVKVKTPGSGKYSYS
ncbi:B3 domain-containing protein At2g32645-like [Eucalyptus grandis]|uniref:B3 domain-containing protein At2g32645-like n=1 Tax=Eucalyptus grandis TaxID=71139 RepID=UPI00192E83A7|nr:B3 domain-containing protein At2g32645-like [Eucalyptus grandis]